jgi:hypothetical protein
MQYSILEFCGILTWTLTLNCIWINPLVPLREARGEDVCLLTMCEVRNLRCSVQADDGYVYDAGALQTWLKHCLLSDKATSIIPGKPIRHVVPVRVVRLIPTVVSQLTSNMASQFHSLYKVISKERSRKTNTRRDTNNAFTQTESTFSQTKEAIVQMVDVPMPATGLCIQMKRHTIESAASKHVHTHPQPVHPKTLLQPRPVIITIPSATSAFVSVYRTDLPMSLKHRTST